MFHTSIDLNCEKSVRLIFNKIVKNPKFTRLRHTCRMPWNTVSIKKNWRIFLGIKYVLFSGEYFLIVILPISDRMDTKYGKLFISQRSSACFKVMPWQHILGFKSLDFRISLKQAARQAAYTYIYSQLLQRRTNGYSSRTLLYPPPPSIVLNFFSSNPP